MSKPSNRRATHGLARILGDDDITTFEDVSEALAQREQEGDENEEDS